MTADASDIAFKLAEVVGTAIHLVMRTLDVINAPHALSATVMDRLALRASLLADEYRKLAADEAAKEGRPNVR